jgi:endonuclease YncB( thermonuclease family)
MATRTFAALLMAWALTACSPSEGETFFAGKVVHVIDGDTLTLRVAGGQGDVRVADIQGGKPLAKRSQQSLSALCAGKNARVEFLGIDGDGPVIGRVWCNGVDVNAEHLRTG